MRSRNCAATSKLSEIASTIVPMALISGVTPRRIETFALPGIPLV